MKKRALISVSDKTGLEDLAKCFYRNNIEIVSTGGTAKTISGYGIPVINISEITGFAELLDGRVKTLHPSVHAALLAIRNNPDHMKQILSSGISPIDFLIVNLYPFIQTIEKANFTSEEAIENIDIGGPAMLRSAAKNFNDVVVLVDPCDYDSLIEKIDAGEYIANDLRMQLAAKVFEHTAHYDATITAYMKKLCKNERFPSQLTLTYKKQENLRYGENPHQSAAFYVESPKVKGTLADVKQLHGKQMSFNNINDVNSAIALLKEFDEPTIVVVKHSNPCGVASGATIEEAYIKAYEADKISIFGGIVAANRQINHSIAKMINEIFIEVIIAPSFANDALQILTLKKNIRLLQIPCVQDDFDENYDIKKIMGGILVQTPDNIVFEDVLKTVTVKTPTEREMNDLAFAWKVVKHVKSNGIVIAKSKQTLGIGTGQSNRIWAVENAIKHAGDKSIGAVLASDAFFPFEDCVNVSAISGITAIIQPGGSIRDTESIDSCNRNGISMVFTGIRHFKH